MGKAASKKSATSKSGALDALAYLTEPEKHLPEGVCAVYGDEAFLKGEVLAALRHQLLGGSDGEFGLSVFAGREVQFRDVRDALSSASLFGDGQRVVIIEDADTFVSDHRPELEDYVASTCREPSDSASAPARRTNGSVLILDVKTWPSNTRLAKAVAASGLAIACEAPKDRQAKSWLTQRAKTIHDVRLEAAAADALLELVPPELGILVQEIAKLALVVGPDRVINVKLVQENVGGWRTRATWDMIDAAADGRAVDALLQLDRLMTSGEKPFGLLPQMASSLRRFPTAVQLIEAAEKNRQRLPPREALAQAGVIPFKLGDAERQLRQIGRQRAKQLTHWLLAADLAMKSHNSSDERARMEIERLIIRLAAGDKAGPPSRGEIGPPGSRHVHELASTGRFFYDPAPHCRQFPLSTESCPSNERMSSTRANLIYVAMGCAFALVQGGCATSLTPPFAKHEVSKNTAAIAATPQSLVTPSVFPAPDATQPDMTVVLDKLQQVRAIDPMAEQRLLDELRKVPPSTWPLVAEQFRASLAYHEQLAAKNRPDSRESQPVVDLRRAPLSNPKQFVAANVTYDESLASSDDRPSAPIGSLPDPHGTNSESVPVLSRKKPHSMPSPVGDVADAVPDPKAPAQFSSDGPAYPIGDRNVALADAKARDTAAEPQHVASQAYGQATGTPAAKLATAVEVRDRDRAVRLPDTRSSNDPNWQISIQKAIADLEHHVSPSPTTTAEVHQHVSLRVLRLLSGDTEKALEPIPHISPSEQDYWSRQLFALATYLDHHSQPDDKRRAAATVTHLDEAVSSLRELGSLSLHNMSFCKTVYGYGAIEPYEADTFSPGQHVSIYVEVENYHSTSSEKGFSTSLGTSYEVLDDHGKRVTSGDFPDVNDCCRSRRRDFHLQLGLKLPDNIAAGRYQVQLLVKDCQSDKIGNAKASFEIRGGKK